MNQIVAETTATEQELFDLLRQLKTTARALLIMGETEMMRLNDIERGMIIAALREQYGYTLDAIALATMEVR